MNFEEKAVDAELLYDFLQKQEANTEGECQLLANIQKYVEEHADYAMNLMTERDAYLENDAYKFTELIQKELVDSFGYSEKEAKGSFYVAGLVEEILNYPPEDRPKPIDWAIQIVLRNGNSEAIKRLLPNQNKELPTSLTDLQVNINSTEKYEEDFGDVMSLQNFIDYCEDNFFTDDDGYANELLWKGNIIRNKQLYPSDLLDEKEKYLTLQEELGELQIVWYNR